MESRQIIGFILLAAILAGLALALRYATREQRARSRARRRWLARKKEPDGPSDSS